MEIDQEILDKFIIVNDTFRDVVVVDDFLPEDEFKELQDLIVFNPDFSFYFQKEVNSSGDTCETTYWNWYQTHSIMNDDTVYSKHFNMFKNLFLHRFTELNIYRALLRIKINMYPYSNVIHEHAKHKDYPFKHKGALFSLNTCDGFTKLYDGTKIDSVANRMMFFDSSSDHNSSTTTNVSARYNINFNFL
tara:strand:+ start:240 stop:809 length:570 start_codon:yes stop_codon:yes gene_type:complete